MGLSVDPILFEVIRNNLESIVDEMALTVVRTAYSNVIRDNMDFSTAFCNSEGELVAQGLTIPLHLGSVPTAMSAFLDAFGHNLTPGDVLLMNDPYCGGIHLPDWFIVKPIFRDAQRVGFAVTIAHQTDVGGRVAGGNASDSTEIFQEGLRIPPVKLVDGGVWNQSLVALIRQNVRVPDLVIGDVRAQLAACHIGERRYLELVDRYGVTALASYLNSLLDYSEARTRADIGALPDGNYRFEDYIDDDGISSDPLPVRVLITVSGTDIVVDFEGTAGQVEAAINSTFASTQSVAYAAVRCVLSPDIPNNEGMFRPIQVRAPEASLVNCVPPGPVAARGLTVFRIGDAVFGALSNACPEAICAAGEGGNTAVSIGGYTRAGRKPFIYVEFLCGAWGGRSDLDGVEGVTNPFSDLSNNPIEVIEAEHPLRIERYGFVQDSGGGGTYRGGLSMTKEYVFLEHSAVLQVRSDRAKYRPYGLFGGQPGGATRNVLTRRGSSEIMATKFTTAIHEGDRFQHVQAGGGGYGAALNRDPESVLQDALDEKISWTSAREVYGVVIDETQIVDFEATQRLRATMGATEVVPARTKRS